MTIGEAAKVLGVTRRTIERRIQRGDIVASRINGKRYVYISETDTNAATVSHVTTVTSSDRDAEIDTLRAELDAIRQERDYLRQHLSQLTAALYRLGDKKALIAPRVEPRPWWAFWRRNQPQQTAA